MEVIRYYPACDLDYRALKNLVHSPNKEREEIIITMLQNSFERLELESSTIDQLLNISQSK